MLRELTYQDGNAEECPEASQVAQAVLECFPKKAPAAANPSK